MTAEEIKKRLGEEYPLAVVTDSGVRHVFYAERPFSRWFHAPEQKSYYVVSRFMDATASMSLKELQGYWSGWTEEERGDFCSNCCWLQGQEDFAEMLRFVMANGSPSNWSAIALSVKGVLPQEEAHGWFVEVLPEMDEAYRSNIIQAMALAGHPAAEGIIRGELAVLMSDEETWEEAKFLNWKANTAVNCIKYLIPLGASASDFAGEVKRLRDHPCARNREGCEWWLKEYYPEIFEREPENKPTLD